MRDEIAARLDLDLDSLLKLIQAIIEFLRSIGVL